MKEFTAILAIAFIFLTAYVAAYSPLQRDPCRPVNCLTAMFGFYELEAELIGYEGDYALCHCPHEPKDRIYKIRVPN